MHSVWVTPWVSAKALSTSAAMPTLGPEKAHGFSGSSTLPMTMPPEISVPPE